MVKTADTIVITGVSSFVGVHLAIFFKKKGYYVLGTVSRDYHDYSDIRRKRLKKAQNVGVELKKLNISVKGSIREFIHSKNPRFWIHHAGWAKKYNDLDYDINNGFQINVFPLEELYSSLAEVSCQGIIITGSSAEYSNTNLICREEDACLPSSPYGLSKLMQTIRARQLCEQYSVPTRVARLFIPFGPMDAPQKLFPSVIHAIKKSTPISLTSCEQSRDFLYIDDLLLGYEALINDFSRVVIFDIFNLCSGRITRLREFISQLVDMMHGDSQILLFGERPLRKGEPLISFGANDKAFEILKWKPRLLKDSINSYLKEEGM